MEAIEIRVSKQMDGYTFWILPSVRQLVKSWSPNFHPANGISVSYDIKSNFEFKYGIYLALLGIDNQNDLIGKVNEIQFVDTKTEKVIHTHKVTE
jgi:hypothetical protein